MDTTDDSILLGAGNAGNLGPDQFEYTEAAQALADVNRAEYAPRAQSAWICMDDRYEAGATRADHGLAPAQLPGSKPVAETAADFMKPWVDGETQSSRLRAHTTEAVANGDVVIVHGDSHAGKAGCAANVKLRPILNYMYSQSAVVAETTGQLLRYLPAAASYLTDKDMTDAIAQAGRLAGPEHDNLWDADPEAAVAAMLAAGAQYQTLAGDHKAAAGRIDVRPDGAFDKVGYRQDHADIGLLAVSLGAYAEDCFRRFTDKHEAALQVMRIALFTVAACKVLGNDSLALRVVSGDKLS